ncbi:hypothetical protein AAG906_029709 [Vitis piasezkii]
MIIMHEYPLHIVEHSGFINFVHTLQPQFNMVSFNSIQGIVLTLDMWTSDENLGYVFLTGHFIDGEWKLHRQILNVVMVPSPESDDAFAQAVVACLADWSLESRLFTITLDQSFSSETMMGNLRGVVSVKNPLIFNGQLLIRNCFARVLSSLAQDALGAMTDTVKKIRESVKYVKTSDAHEEKFLELKHQLQVPSVKTLFINDYTKWNSTYHMLAAACELKEVFSCLDTFDPDYKEAPSMDDWKQFDRYWKDTSLVLAIAVVMDPRFKMKLVEFSFSKIYGAEAEMWIKIVDEGIRELLLTMLHNRLFYLYNRLMLKKSLMPRSQDFDVLAWWKLNKLKYPTLSRMASDILSIPITTVGPDNVFDTVGRKIDSYRSSLRPVTLEALICAKDWLQNGATEPDMSVPPIVKMEF